MVEVELKRRAVMWGFVRKNESEQHGCACRGRHAEMRDSRNGRPPCRRYIPGPATFERPRSRN